MKTQNAEIIALPDRVNDSHTECWIRYQNTAIQSLDQGFAAIEQAIWTISDMELLELQARIIPLVARFNKEIHLRTVALTRKYPVD